MERRSVRDCESVALTVTLYRVSDWRPLTCPIQLVRPGPLWVESIHDPSGAISLETPTKIRAGVSVRTETPNAVVCGSISALVMQLTAQLGPLLRSPPPAGVLAAAEPGGAAMAMAARTVARVERISEFLLGRVRAHPSNRCRATELRRKPGRDSGLQRRRHLQLHCSATSPTATSSSEPDRVGARVARLLHITWAVERVAVVGSEVHSRSTLYEEELRLQLVALDWPAPVNVPVRSVRLGGRRLVAAPGLAACVACVADVREAACAGLSPL